jgi:hypothetical protein
VSPGPHFFFADGTDAHNPGLTVRWEGPWASGYPIIEDDEPGVWDDLILRSGGASSRMA